MRKTVTKFNAPLEDRIKLCTQIMAASKINAVKVTQFEDGSNIVTIDVYTKKLKT